MISEGKGGGGGGEAGDRFDQIVLNLTVRKDMPEQSVDPDQTP